jgi:hypothetical protein
VERELERRAEQARVSVAAVRAFAEKQDGMDGIRNQALTKKVFDFLVAASEVNEKVITDAESAAGATAPAESGGEPAAPLPVETAVSARRADPASGADETESR